MVHNPGNSEIFLRQFHAQHAGATSKMGNARTSSGCSSYQLLAQLIPHTVQPAHLHLDGSIEQVKAYLFLTYYVGIISPDGLETLKARTTEALRSLQREDGTVPCSVGLRRVLCKKRVA